MELADQFASERRTRLAAERLMAQMKTELSDANRALSRHAQSLSTEIVSSREEIGRVKTEAETLKSEVTHVREDLVRAESAMVIAERRLWDSLETIRDGFAVFGPDNNMIVANRAYLAIFEGLEMVQPGIPMSELVELLADEGIVDTGGLSSRAWQAGMLRRLDQPRIEQSILKLWNGQYIRLIDRRTGHGDLVTLALNITEQTKREEQLREAREKAEAANRAKSAFLANMSHEIRTPMNGVVAMADLMTETAMDEEQRAYVETIRSSGEALLVIINDVLDYSKIEADQISFKSQPFDLEKCIHEVVTLLQPGALDKGLQIAVDYDLFMPTSYTGDAGRIRQILTNLVGNAIKFTEEGHIVIRVVGLPGEGDRDYRVHITVEDTGIGIPADKLETVFREFQQVENERDRTHDGTGLGLAITQRLVTAMGGEVWVDSRENVGSGFGFFLPMVAIEDVEPDDISAPKWMERAIVLDAPGMNRTVLQKQLGLIGLKTVMADSVNAIVEAQPHEKDIVFLGHGVGEENEFRMAEKLRGQFPVAGMFLLVSGPTRVPEGGMAFDRLLQRPVLRAAMMDCLLSLEEPALQEKVEEPSNAPIRADVDQSDVVREDEFSAVTRTTPVEAEATWSIEEIGPQAGAAEAPDPTEVPEVARNSSASADTTSERDLDAPTSEKLTLLGDRVDHPPTVQSNKPVNQSRTGSDHFEFHAPAHSKPDAPVPVSDPAVDKVWMPGVGKAEAEPPAPQIPRPMRVLAAEDNRTNRFVIEKMLKDLNIDLVFAVNGVEAVELFENWAPDIVFTDISMPKMDGKEATRRIRFIEAERGSEPCPIIAITAHAMDGDAEDILASGVDHYLTKPLKKSS
ncbi:MAG: response regulator [Boseongicola sp.]|nr:MAG: response regulator [Boseongicola sp.]